MKVGAGKSAGRVVAKQMRCVYCIKTNKNRKSRRTAYICICHKDAFCCKEGVGGCWENHLKEYGCTTANTAPSDDDDDFGTDSD